MVLKQTLGYFRIFSADYPLRERFPGILWKGRNAMDSKPQWMNDPEMCSYFNSLPPYVQENMMQSSMSFCSMQELRACAEKLQRAE